MHDIGKVGIMDKILLKEPLHNSADCVLVVKAV
jgi:response regulator RpfG family c-di-GMP phosphodiesterase